MSVININKLGIFISVIFVIICLFISEPELILVKVGGLPLSIALLIFFLSQEMEAKYVLSSSRIKERALKAGKIEIPRSKSKAIVVIIGAIGFAIAGTSMALDPEAFVSSVARNPTMIRIIGIITSVCSIFSVIYATKKLFDKTLGLIIDENGITDTSSASSVGFIKWSDVESVNVIEIFWTKILVVKTNRPLKYISQAKNLLVKQILESNNKNYGTPILFSSTSLKIGFNDLQKLIVGEFENYIRFHKHPEVHRHKLQNPSPKVEI